MADTTAVLVAKDGNGALRNIGGTTPDAGTTFYGEHNLRVDGAIAGAANPVPVVNTTPGIIALTVGAAAVAGRSFAVNATVAGNVAVTFSDGSSSVYPVSVGLNVFPFAITLVKSTGTTATATYENWK